MDPTRFDRLTQGLVEARSRRGLLGGVLADRFGPDRFWPTVGAAVDSITGELRGDLGPEP